MTKAQAVIFQMGKTAVPQQEVGRLVIKNRLTGELVNDGVPMYPSDIPFHYPHPETVVWRYLSWAKFEDLIVNRRLYFRRSDRLEDDMEGRYSRANRRYRTALWQRFHDAYTIRQDTDQETQISESFRHRAFLNCWHMNRNESAKMWKLYTRSAESVVIRSNCRLLDLNVGGQAYPAVLVQYISQDEPRPEYHRLAPLVFKDSDFSFEKEVRLILFDGDGTAYPTSEAKEHISRTLSIKPESLILEVRLHPAASKHFRRKVKELCRNLLPHIPVIASALRKSLLT